MNTTMKSLCAAIVLLMLNLTVVTGVQAGWSGSDAGGSVSIAQLRTLSLALSPAGVPYVSFSDGAYGGSATVKMLSNGVWSLVGGAPITSGDTAAWLSMNMTPGSGTPYAAYSDTANSQRCTTTYFSSGTWNSGNNGSYICSGGQADYVNMAFDANGQQYVAYVDWANGQKATVMKYTSSGWTPLGSPGVSAGAVEFPSLAVDQRDGTPYLAYVNSPSGAPAVKKYNAGTNSWDTVGDFGTATMATAVLAISPKDGTLYVAYKVNTDYYKGHVKKYNSGTNAWEDIGGTVSTGEADYFNLAIAPNGTPVVAYGEYHNLVRTSQVKVFSGGAWKSIGNGFSTDISALAVATAGDGTVWVATTEWSIAQYKHIPYVAKYQLAFSGDPATSATVGSAYSFTPAATNANGFSISGNVPPGLSFNTTTGALTGTPTTAGTYSNIVITAANYTQSKPLAPFTITVAGIAPGTPTIGTATAGNAQASVTFTPPPSNGSPITGYTAKSNPGNLTGTGTASPVIVPGLTNGTSYTFTVTATNAFGTGPASGASNQVTPKGVPGAPTGVAAAAGNGQATVSFTAPAANGSAITSYTVTSNPGNKTATGGSSPITMTGLTNGTLYTLSVTAANNIGVGPAAQVTVTPRTVPDAPAITSATAGNGTATVTFTAPAFNGGSAITGYTVSGGGIDSNAGSLLLTHTITGLTNGTPYTLKVAATNIAGTGPASAGSTVTPQKSNQTITFNQPPAQTYGTTPTIASYASASSGLSISFSSATTNICSVTAGGQLTFASAGSCIVNADQSGNASYNAAPQVNRTITINAIAPTAPTIGTAAGGNSLATVTFAPSSALGGSPLALYTVTSTPGNLTGTGSASPITVYGLTNGIAYTFSVTATNSAGLTSTASAASNSVIPALVFTPVTQSYLYHTATQLSNGKLLIVGGQNKSNAKLSTAELYDPTTGVYTATGSMSTARIRHTATLLPNGKVLIAGGQNSSALSSAELYDPGTGTFSVTGTMSSARYTHTATLLTNGKVLIAGGQNGSVLNTAELYDPATGSFTAIGTTMTKQRTYHTATEITTGKVLIAGGYNGSGYEATAELYDPTGNTFSATGSMNKVRNNQTSTLLPNGKVLITGGWNDVDLYMASTELYDPAGSGTFSATTANLTVKRQGHTATLLPNGKVLIAGGNSDASTKLASTELYDPVANTFTASSTMSTARKYHTATILPYGNVLISGGDSNGGLLATSELYDPAVDVFTSTNSLNGGRYNYTATLLPNGKVLIAGGIGSGGFLNTAELYDPTTSSFAATGNTMTTSRCYHTATLLTNGMVLIAGGELNGEKTELTSMELYDPGSNTFSSAGNMTTKRAKHTATLLANGRVLFTGGQSDGAGSEMSSSEVYSPDTGACTATGNNMTVARNHHSATLLPNGKVLIAGGWNQWNTFLASAELFDPSTGIFTATTGNLIAARESHSATLLTNGKVLISGGWNGSANINSAVLYDPATDIFTATNSNMTTPRAYHTATLLPNGQVLTVGGYSGATSSYLASAELYDPPTNTYMATVSMNAARRYHTATLLQNGKVLIAGGYNPVIIASAELYDRGLGFSNSVRPVLSSITTTSDLAVAGSGFTGVSEGSTGSSNSSATNYPLVHLRRLDNEQSGFVYTNPSINWTATSVAASNAAFAGWPNGQYLTTVFANGIPSLSSTVVLAAPDAPAITSVSSSTTQQATVTFTAPGYAGSSAITGYTVTSNPAGGTDSEAGTIGGLSHEMTGLTNNVSYTFTVTATNSFGTSPPSAPSGSVTPQKSSQTITFTQPDSQTFGTTPSLATTAIATSALAIEFSSATPGVCAITADGILNFLTAGTCSINADQAGDARISAAPTVTQSFTVNPIVPDAPGIGTAIAGDGQATVAFSAPVVNGGSAVTGYTVTSSPAGGTDSNAGSTGLSHVVTGLTNGVLYTFTVTATNLVGDSSPSDASNAIMPMGVQTITFSQPPAQTFGTQPTIAAYAAASSGLPVIFTSATTDVCTVTGDGALTFVKGGSCTINVDQGGSSAYVAASQVSHTFQVNAVVPGAPAIDAVSAGDGQATVTFYPPAFDGGSAITGYSVTSSPDDITVTGVGSPITVTGLSNGTSYTFTVTAINAVNAGTASSPSDPVTPHGVQTITFGQPSDQDFGTSPTLTASASSTLTVYFGSATPGVCLVSPDGVLTFVAAGTCTINANQDGDTVYNAAPEVSRTFTVRAVVPGAPIIGTATAGNAQATVTVSPPASDGGSAITGYTVVSSPAGGTDSDAGSTGLSHLVTGLANGTAYTFTVTAVNAAGTGPASGSSDPVTPQVNAPVNQTITFNQPSSQQFGTTPTLTATATSGLTVTFSSETTGVCTITAGGDLIFVTAGTCTIDADQAGNASYNAAPRVSRSFTVNAIIPGAPTIGTATAGNGQASVAFTAPANTGGTTITGYTVTSTPGNITATGATSPLTVTGLTNGTSYTFTVTASNSAGTGPASAASNLVTPQKDSQTITFEPNAAYNFGTTPTLTATATSGLTVMFTSASQTVCTISSGGTLTFLTIGTCSINADQAGNASYLAAPQVNKTFTVSAVSPGAPTSVTVIAGNGQAIVSFSAPAFDGGSAITGYTVTSTPGSITATGSASPIVVGGLTNGTTYTFTVTATNQAGSGSSSNASNGVQPGVSPVTTATPGTGSYHNSGAMPVTLSTTSGGTIYYSTNGNPPTTVYSQPINILGNVIVKYRTVGYGANEAVKSAVYSVRQ